MYTKAKTKEFKRKCIKKLANKKEMNILVMFKADNKNYLWYNYNNKSRR